MDEASQSSSRGRLGSPRVDYLVTTESGCVPYIIDMEGEYLQKGLKVYVDDFVYKDSFYVRGGESTIRQFIGACQPVYLSFRGRPSVLTSKRGNFVLKSEAYSQLAQRMRPEGAADYSTGRLVVNGLECREPASLGHFMEMVGGTGAVLFGTGFINGLIREAKLLVNINGRLETRALKDSGAEYEYEAYMLSINEMNAYTFVAESNYRAIHEYVQWLNGSDTVE